MKTVSIRELHQATGAWVRKAVSLGTLTVTDRGKAIACITAAGDRPRQNPFRARKLRPGYARLRGKLGGGTDSTAILAGDRDGR